MNNSIECCDNELTQSIIDQLCNTYSDSDIIVRHYEHSMTAYKDDIVCDKCQTSVPVYFRNVDLPDTIEAGWYKEDPNEDWDDFATALGDAIEIYEDEHGPMRGMLFVVDNLVFACMSWDDYCSDSVQLIATIDDNVMIELKKNDHNINILEYPPIKDYIKSMIGY